MTPMLSILRREPALIGGLVSIIVTLCLTLTHNDPTVGAILAAVEAAVALVVRQNVSPVSSSVPPLTPAQPGTPPAA